MTASPTGTSSRSAGALDGIAFLDVEVVAEDDGADGVFFEVEDLTHGAVLEFEQFAGHGVAQAVDAGDAVADFDDGADFVDLQSLFEAGDFLLEDAGDFRDVDGHFCFSLFLIKPGGRPELLAHGRELARTLPSISWSCTRRTMPPMIARRDTGERRRCASGPR